MCEQSEVNYLDEEVVWVKLGSCWWPGEVVGADKLPPDVLPSFRKPPIAVVKFFQEDAYEYVKNHNSIYKYNCSRKDEFINKGLYMYRTKHGHMEKFPEDVIRAEAAVGGDITILTRDEFQETKKESYANLFGDPAKRTPLSNKKGRGGRGRSVDSNSGQKDSPARKINVNKPNYKVHILVQGSQTPPAQPMSTETASTPSTSRADSEPTEEKLNAEEPVSTSPVTPNVTSSGIYSCHACPFTTTRLNVLILHNKTHSVTFMPYTPSPVRKKITKPLKPSPNAMKTPKSRKSRPEKTDKIPKKSVSQKRVAEDIPIIEVKKTKTDEEIKSSLLADWDIDEDSNDESSVMVMAGSPEVAAPAESPAVAAPAELPEAQVPLDLPPHIPKSPEDTLVVEKPESSSDSKYEFCEDEDWPEEADVGRKIPRVKNPKRKEDTKSISLDEDEVAKEVAELLNKTTVPELPTAPEPLKVEENFPEPSIVKSPDKKLDTATETDNVSDKKSTIEAQPPKTIFKTKTFFRSRHSRSQDAIGKYVAEQLNAERIDIAEDINGSEILSTENRVSPPIVEPIKVARLAPKIQLKKMKAEAAQMRDKEKKHTDIFQEDFFTNCTTPVLKAPISLPEHVDTKDKEEVNIKKSDEIENMISLQHKQEVQNNIAQVEVEHLTKTDDIILGPLKEYLSPKRSDYICKFKPQLEQISQSEKEKSRDIQEHSLLNQNNSQNYKENNEKIETIQFRIEEEPHIINYDLRQKQDITLHDHAHVMESNETQSNDAYENNCAKNEEDIYKKNIKNTHHIDSCNGNKTETIIKVVPQDTVSEIICQTSNSTESEKDFSESHMDEAMTSAVHHTEPHIKESGVRDVHSPEISIEESSVAVVPETHVDECMVSNVHSTEPLINEPVSKESHSTELPKVKSMTPIRHSAEPYMNESTASAVDALLSVSRDADRVTKTISNDLPEDLFEDDIKESNSSKTINGFETCDKENDVKQDMETNKNAETPRDIECDGVVEISTKANTHDDEKTKSEITSNECQDTKGEILESIQTVLPENIPSESDLVIAETLINLPSTTIQNNSNTDSQENMSLENKQNTEEPCLTSNTVILEDNKADSYEMRTQNNVEIPSNHLTNTNNVTARFQTEQEKSENLNAAQSLVQMSESVEHKINVGEIKTLIKKDNTKPLTYKSVKDHDTTNINKNALEQKAPLLSIEKSNETLNCKTAPFETTSPKLLKILEEPCPPKPPTPNLVAKQIIVPGQEKILNFDVGSPGISNRSHSPKQKIIIRRSNTPHKNLLNNISEVTSSDKIILSRSNNTPQDGPSVQTYTIKTAPDTPSDPNTFVIQQKIRKITKAPNKSTKNKPHTSLVSPIDTPKVINDTQSKEDPIFDINAMPIVLSDDILTPESIEKMPIVMTDGNIITNAPKQQKIKPKQTIIENEKIAISPISQNPPKQEFKTLIMNPVTEVNKVTTPNILSKSSKLRGTKMLLIDKTSVKQKIIMKQAPPPEPPVKEIKPQAPIIQSITPNPGKAEKFILLPTTASPRQGGRTQKIVIDPQTGKAHMLFGKGADTPLHVTDNKPVSAKLVPSASDATSHGNTVMIITNAQGAQSRIVLKPEHEKILFPNKQQPNVSQLKAITHRVSPNSPSSSKAVVTTVASAKTPTRIVPKQKSAIITSKGQLIVGGRVTTTAQNIAPMPEIRPAPKRIVSGEPKKIVQTIQKNASEPLIFFQQKSGAVMQLTAAQFEHLQRTGQIIQKTIPAPVRENKIVLQKTVNISPSETIVSNIQKPRARKQIVESPTPVKKVKQEIAIAPAPTPMPALCPISNTVATIVPPTVSTPSTASTSSYSSLENFEELLPSTAIARLGDPGIPPPEPPAPSALSDGQLLAIPGEHFGGPLGSFYLCMEDNGAFTPIDNRPLVLENNQLVPMPEAVPALPPPQPERRDILEAALANSDVFHGETVRDEAPDFRDLNANVSLSHCRVSETSTTLNQPIMTPVEVPTKVDSEPAVPANLEDGLAVIGVTPPTVPTSLELPITVTDPRIALKATDPLRTSLGNTYGASLLTSPSTEMPLVATEEVDVPTVGPISMPLLTEEESVGKSMPILTDDVSERIVSSVESVGSPSSIDATEPGSEDGSGQWPRRLLTPGSDASEISAEIPLQPQIKLSVSDIK